MLIRCLTALLLLVGVVSLSSAGEPAAVTFGRRAAQAGDVQSQTLVIESRSTNGAQIASWTLVRRVKVLTASPQGGITDAQVDQPRSSVWVNFCMFGFPASDLKGSFRYTRDVDTFRVRRIGAPKARDGLTTFSRLVLSKHARELQAGPTARFMHALPVGKPVRVGQRVSCVNPVAPRLLDQNERAVDRPMFHPFFMTFDRQTMTLRRTEQLKGIRCGVFDAALATPVGPTVDGLNRASASLTGTVWIEVATGRLRRFRADGTCRLRRAGATKKTWREGGTIHLRLDVDYSSPTK